MFFAIDSHLINSVSEVNDELIKVVSKSQAIERFNDIIMLKV